MKEVIKWIIEKVVEKEFASAGNSLSSKKIVIKSSDSIALIFIINRQSLILTLSVCFTQ